jgi:hypothetical protein
MDRMELCWALVSGEVVKLTNHQNVEIVGQITRVEREDGSGFNFNVRMTDMRYNEHLIFVKCNH